MPFLIDSHVLVWSSAEPERLSRRVLDLLADPAGALAVSVASLWELSIKRSLGRLELPASPFSAARWMGLEVLPVAEPHLDEVERLPWLHRDPFDRMLVAQSRVEGCPIVTADRAIRRYAVEVLW